MDNNTSPLESPICWFAVNFFDIGRNNALVSSERITTWGETHNIEYERIKTLTESLEALSIRGLKHIADAADLSIRGLQHYSADEAWGLKHKKCRHRERIKTHTDDQ